MEPSEGEAVGGRIARWKWKSWRYQLLKERRRGKNVPASPSSHPQISYWGQSLVELNWKFASIEVWDSVLRGHPWARGRTEKHREWMK